MQEGMGEMVNRAGKVGYSQEDGDASEYGRKRGGKGNGAECHELKP